MLLHRKLATRASMLVLVLIGASCKPASRTASGHGSASPSVVSFEVNVIDLAGEVAFLQQLDFTTGPVRELNQPAFAQLLGMTRARASESVLALEEQRLELRQFSDPAPRRAQPAHANDLGFEHIAIVVRDMDAAFARLQQSGAELVSVSPQTLPASNPVAGGVRAEYFRDPSGHFMELLQFPPDKGDKAWHRSDAPLFLGIDHSALAVRHSGESLRFYRDALGLEVKSESLNEGPEQEALSHVPGARVHITSLRGERGAGVELLEYIAPATGAPFAKATPADAVHWEIAIRVADLEHTLEALRAAGFAAPERTNNVSAVLPGELEAVLVHDPDGHTIRLSQGAP